ncbi:MAG: cytochrome b [Burkholderiales bacterium]|nr:cytochrome b [Burkholderiales bacterium]
MNNFNEALVPAPKTPWRYSTFSIGVHWAAVVLLPVAATLGWYMVSIEDDPGADWYFAQHKSWGLVFALLLVVRLVWRLLNRPEPLPLVMPKWQQWLASGTQVLLYALMVLVPLTGYLGASHTEPGVQLFGTSLPVWAVPSHDTAEWLFEIHEAMIWALGTLVAVHVAGALKHLLIDKDGVFLRMWIQSANR